eukprot:3643355-Rhodomonas_salina.1
MSVGSAELNISHLPTLDVGKCRTRRVEYGGVYPRDSKCNDRDTTNTGHTTRQALSTASPRMAASCTSSPSPAQSQAWSAHFRRDPPPDHPLDSRLGPSPSPTKSTVTLQLGPSPSVGPSTLDTVKLLLHSSPFPRPATLNSGP